MPSKPKLQWQALYSVLRLNGSRNHVHEAHDLTGYEPGNFQRQVTTAAPATLDFRRTGILDEGFVSTMLTDSTCSIGPVGNNVQGVERRGVAMLPKTSVDSGGLTWQFLGRDGDWPWLKQVPMLACFPVGLT